MLDTFLQELTDKADADSEIFVRGSPTQTTFLVDGAREDPNITKSGPSCAHKRNAKFQWCFV